MKLSDEILFLSITRFFCQHSNPHQWNLGVLEFPAPPLLHLHYIVAGVIVRFVNAGTEYLSL